MGGSAGGSGSFGRPSQPSGGQQPTVINGETAAGLSGAGGGQLDECSGIDVTVTLQSPQPIVVQKLRKADRLRLELTNGAAPIRAVTDAGETAGAIIPPDIQKLVDCLRNGHTFIAEVLQVSGGAVRVRVFME